MVVSLRVCALQNQSVNNFRCRRCIEFSTDLGRTKGLRQTCIFLTAYHQISPSASFLRLSFRKC